MTVRSPIVDVHAHHFPLGLPNLAAEHDDARWPTLVVDDDPRIMLGDNVFRRVRPACYDPVARLAELDAAGVHQQVISPVPITLIEWAPPDDAVRFLAAQNDLLSELASGSNGRLFAFGAVPLQDTALAVAELIRIRRELSMAGVEIGAAAAGREFDDPALDEFWATAAELEMPVFVHPTRQYQSTRRADPPFGFGLEMLTDTALAAGALVFGGVLERHPDLRVAMAHGCGTFPWAYPRMRYITTLRQPGDRKRIDQLVGRLWTDALVFDPSHIALLCERFGDGHVMYGTDHPFLPEGFEGPRDVLSHAGSPAGCLGANALNFLGARHGAVGDTTS